MQAMATIAAACVLLIALTTFLHYEVLRLLSFGLPRVHVLPRAKLLVVMFSVFVAHFIEMALYGLAAYFLVHGLHLGSLVGADPTLENFLYFSAETYTSLGFGDIVPGGSLRLFAGVEALNGLLLIGWSASYVVIAMERFWGEPSHERGKKR